MKKYKSISNNELRKFDGSKKAQEAQFHYRIGAKYHQKCVCV